ncbi:MAG: LAGLIDADG family homing endonuclease [Nitrososphaerota archaeon]
MPRKLDHDLRIKLFYEVVELRGRGYSYGEIMREISRRHGVTLSKSHVSEWTRGIHLPMNESYNRPDLAPSPELAIIAAAASGDGTIKDTEDGAIFMIEMRDLEPIELVARCLAKIFGKPEPYFIGRRSNGRYYTQIKSRNLYNYLSIWDNVVQLLHRYPREFMRMFFECEGGPCGFITHKKDFRFLIEASNTNLQLLQVMGGELARLGISSRIYLAHKAGRVSISGSRGIVFARKDCYSLRISRAESIKRYAAEIGFISERKQRKLMDIIEIYEAYGCGMDAAIEWMRRYEYRRCGRERWMRRDQPLSREQAVAELQACLLFGTRPLKSVRRENAETYAN